MTWRDGIIALLAGALGLPLTRLTTVTTADIQDPQYWLQMATVALSGGAAAGLAVLAVIARRPPPIEKP